MSFKKFVTLVFGLFIAFGCLHASYANDGDYVFILAAQDNPYWTALGEGIKDTAKAKGITPVILSAQSGKDAEGELNICLTAIQRKPKIIVMGSQNASVGIQCYKQAATKGILVADIDATLTLAEAAKAGITLSFSVGSDNYRVGEEAAKFAQSISVRPNPKILILEGVAGSIPNQKRVTGFKRKLQELLPKASIVAILSADWDRLKAMNTTLDILQRQPDLDMIYAANDTMALGAVEAVRNLHRETHIKVIGVDGTSEARKSVTDGHLTATVAQLPYLMGKHAVELAFDAIATGKTGVTVVTETPVLTQDMLTANKDPLLHYVR